MDINELRKKVQMINWHHTFDFGNGIITPGGGNFARKLKRLKMPSDLSGKTVLDIGAWDGFFSFEAERRGAKRVLATDYYCWSGPGCGTKDGFELARKVFKSKVEDMEVDIMDISPETVGVFDLVLFLGVLYHMKHPILALEKTYSVTGEQLILETHVDMVFNRRPLLAFYPGNELCNDETNWFGPNISAVVGMLESVGFRRIEVVWKPSFIHRLGNAIKQKLQGKDVSILRASNQGRAVFHAWK